MSTLQEQVKRFSELPSLKMNLDDLRLKLESLEKIKSTISNDNYTSLSNSYQKQIIDLTSKGEKLQTELSALKNEIDLDSKVLEGEISLVEKELQELQFLTERGALSKQDYDVKKSNLQQKLTKNKSHFSKNQYGIQELDFYSTYIGTDNFINHKYKEQTGKLKSNLSNIKPKVFVTLGVCALLILATFFLYKPIKSIIVEKIAWNKAIKDNTFESYGLYISKYPTESNLSKAQINQEIALWGSIKTDVKISLIDKYINLYSNGSYLKEAINLKDSLIWANTCKSNNATSYSEFLTHYPKSLYFTQAYKKLNEFVGPNSFIDERDYKIYKTIKIGEQMWMAENLAYKINSGCWVYDNNESNLRVYGYLYNWETAKLVCPLGWHLPSQAEWNTMYEYLGGSSFNNGSDIVADKMKESGSLNWSSSNNTGTNESGFSALPSGALFNGEYRELHSKAFWWSSQPYGRFRDGPLDVFHVGVGTKAIEYVGSCNSGLAVRCVKD